MNKELKDLPKYFTIVINGRVFVPTVEDRNKYLCKLHYKSRVFGELVYPLIKDDYTKEGWKIIKRDIKENMYINLKRCEEKQLRLKLFGVNKEVK